MDTQFPILSWLIITLPIGAALIWLLPRARYAPIVALVTALIDLALSLSVILHFDTTQTGFQLIEKMAWIPTLHIEYHLGVDGLSVLFPAFTVILFIGVILASWNSVRNMTRLYYTLLLLLESATIGIFCALDTMLFFLFWELSLIPLFFLISLWGIGPQRRYAAVKYTLFMLASGIPMLFGFLLLAFNHAEINQLTIAQGLMFDYVKLLQIPVSPELQFSVFVLFLIGFAAKTPLFPLHTWLPTAASEGPITIAALLTGLKLGAYGLLRYVVPLTPQAVIEYQHLLLVIGMLGMIYAGVIALNQTNIRRMLAYASISHVGLVVAGIATLTVTGIQGAVLQLLNFTVISGGLFLLTSYIHQRTGTCDIKSLGGLASSTPALAAFFMLFGLASLGIPGTNGFIAEFLLLYSVFSTNTGIGILGLIMIVFSAAYFTIQYRKVFFGPVGHEQLKLSVDLTRREMTMIVTFAVLILVIGLYPEIILQYLRAESLHWLARVK